MVTLEINIAHPAQGISETGSSLFFLCTSRHSRDTARMPNIRAGTNERKLS